MVEEVDLPTLAAGRLLAVAVAQAVAQWVEIAELLLDSATWGALLRWSKPVGGTARRRRCQWIGIGGWLIWIHYLRLK